MLPLTWWEARTNVGKVTLLEPEGLSRQAAPFGNVQIAADNVHQSLSNPNPIHPQGKHLQG